MTSSRYSLLVIFGTLSLLFLVAGVNYFVDPAHIYDTYRNSSNTSAETAATYVKRLAASDYGLFYANNVWNERDIKRQMAEQLDKTVDCAVIGSSRVMQISSWRRSASLQRDCKQLVNLGVSGASLEDYLALSWNLLQNRHCPRKIVFGIDPWSLNFRRDANWIFYQADYEAVISILNGEGQEKNSENNDKENTESAFSPFFNLINMDYFVRSLKTLDLKRHHVVWNAPAFDLKTGMEERVLLPDGSIVYSAAYIRKSATQPVIEVKKYKIISGSWFDQQAILLLQKLIGYLRARDIDVVFVLSPYHPFVWSQKASDTLKAMQVVEERVRDIADKEQIKVLGSYDPTITGCTPDEFFDFMHPKDVCVARFE